MKQILLCSNSDKAEMTEFVLEQIHAKGIEAKIYFPFAPPNTFSHRELLSEDPEKDAESAALLICLGGDGTILACSGLAARAEIPILGINYGHKGFIAALEPDEIETLGDILDGRFVTEDRMMVAAEVFRAGESVCSGFGLNEAVIRSAGAHPVKISVYGDGVQITAFSGDGIIVATPTGSTAYSMSAGGPIVEPNARNLIITPICAHALNAKTVVLRDDRIVSIRLEDSPSFEAVVTLDGGATFALEPEDEIRVSRSEHITKLVVGTKRSFYELVQRKLNTEL